MNEPKLLKTSNNKKERKILIVATILLVMLFIGTSYALLTSYDETEEVITVKTGNLNMEITTSNKIDLGGELPKSDEEGFANTEIKITLKNTGTMEIGKYEVKLIKDKEKTSSLEEKYIRESISEEDNKRYKVSNILSEVNNIIYTGYNLKVGESKVIYLKVWLDEESGEAILNKNYNGSINVELYQEGTRDENLVEAVKKELTTYYYGKNADYSGGLVAVNNTGDLYNETDTSQEIREYRYNGPSVNNYVKLKNINPETKQTEDELWRIISVSKETKADVDEEYVTLVRDTELIEYYFPTDYIINGITYTINSSVNTVYWNKNDSGIQKNDYSQAGLQYFLNSEQDSANNMGYMSYLSTETKNMLQERVHYLGTVTYKEENGETGLYDTAKEAYQHERDVLSCNNDLGPETNKNQETVEGSFGCRVWALNHATWEGKIGLMYPSDYGYSVNSNNWDKKLGNFTGGFADLEIKDTSWMYKTIPDIRAATWFISPTSDTAGIVAAFREGVSIDHLHIAASRSRVRPTLNLSTQVKIISGTGSKDNPYQLSL